MSPTVTLTPFFRASDDEIARALGPAAYVAGFEDQDGEPWGMAVPLEAEDVEPVVLGNKHFSVSMRPDGTLLIEADGLSDAAIEHISGHGPPLLDALDDLVREVVRPEQLAMEDDPKAELQKLGNRLRDALGLVEEALQSLS